MYQSIYNLIVSAIYDNAALTGWQDMFVTIIASACVLFALAVPFIVVWKVICLVVGR